MILCVTSITDFISKIHNPSLWTRLHLVHYWDVLLEAGCDVSEAFLLSVAKIEAEQYQRIKKQPMLSGTLATVQLTHAFRYPNNGASDPRSQVQLTHALTDTKHNQGQPTNSEQ